MIRNGADPETVKTYVHDQSGLDATTSFNVLMESVQQDCPAFTPSMVKWERGLREAGALPPVGN
jgi:hypothetical protein